MRFKLYKPTDIPSELLCAVIMLAALFGNLSPKMGLLGNCIGLFLAMVVLVDCVIKNRVRLVVLVLFAGSIILGTYNVMFVGQLLFQRYIVTGVIFFAVGLYLNVADTLDFRLWRGVFIIAAAFIMLCWFTSPDGYQLFYQVGRNFVSVLLFVYLMPMVLAAEKNQVKIWIGYYVLIVMCSISAIGRSGIACSALLLCCVAVYRLLIDEKLTIRRRYINICFCLMMAAAGYAVLYKYWDKVAGRLFSRFVQDNSSSDAARMKILTEYLKTVDSFPKILLGSNSRVIPYLEQWGGNIHNAYLMTHASYGVIGASVLVVSIAAAIVLMLKNGYIELGMLIAVFALRSFVDSVFQAKPGDMIAWYCIIYAALQMRIGREVYLIAARGETGNG